MPRHSPGPSRLAAVLCVAFGVALTLSMQGYQFGKSNHTVYLIDALRHTHPGTLDHDWFATQTLQYHAAFGLMTRWLMKLDVIRPAFLVGHVGLAILLHLAWWRIVRALRGGVAAFVLSELLFHVSGGTGLGMYQFLQDGAFLPSNIAAVAFLWAIYFWIVDRRAASAVMCGVAGLFHLNYAIVAPAVWVTLAAMSWRSQRRRLGVMELLGAAAMLELCLMNVVPAMLAISSHRGERMPFESFVAIYVHLRHPHHYAPLTWPVGLWLSFLWPISFAWLQWRRRDDDDLAEPDDATRQVRRVVDVLSLLLLVAFLGAGVWYVSETLVQLSLWRFSVFVKLLTCVGAAMFFVELLKRDRLVTATSAVAGCAIVIACLIRGPYLGFFRIPEDDPKYLAACDWIRDHTPADAVFLVPPDEQEFRLRAERAIVVNYKCVPQLSRELPAWRQRLADILMIDLRELPAGSFDRTLHEIRHLYDTRSPEHLEKAAGIYNARFIIVGHRLGDGWEPRRVREMDDATDGYFLYDLNR